MAESSIRVWHVTRIERGWGCGYENLDGRPRVWFGIYGRGRGRRAVDVDCSLWVREFGGHDFPSGAKIVLRHEVRSDPPNLMPEPVVTAREVEAE